MTTIINVGVTNCSQRRLLSPLDLNVQFLFFLTGSMCIPQWLWESQPLLVFTCSLSICDNTCYTCNLSHVHAAKLKLSCYGSASSHHCDVCFILGGGRAMVSS